MWVDRGVASAQYTGLLRLGAAVAAVACHSAFLREANAAASLVDYRGAACDFDRAVVSRAVRRAASSSVVICRPGAYIVRHDELPNWRAYARQLCGSGLLRAAFSDAEQARAWVADMAALADAQAIHHALWR